jgi:hypothetical protein
MFEGQVQGAAYPLNMLQPSTGVPKLECLLCDTWTLNADLNSNFDLDLGHSMKINRFAVIVSFLAFGACASSNGSPTEPVVYSQSEAADSVRVHVSQTIVVEGIKIRFSAVESDSRCPMDAVCIWQGDAVANFVVEQNCDCRSAALELKLHTTLEPKSGTGYGFRVELRQLQPYPRASSPTKPDAYYAWIRVTRES